MNPEEFKNWTSQMVKLTDGQLQTLRDLAELMTRERESNYKAAQHFVSRGAW